MIGFPFLVQMYAILLAGLPSSNFPFHQWLLANSAAALQPLTIEKVTTIVTTCEIGERCEVRNLLKKLAPPTRIECAIRSLGT